MGMEELPPIQLCLLLNWVKFDNDDNLAIEQSLKVIDNDVLKMVNRRKWDEPVNIEPSFFRVIPSVQGHSFQIVWAGTSIFLFGGFIFEDSYRNQHVSRRMFSIDASNVFANRESLQELSPITTQRFHPPSVTVDGKIYVFGDTDSGSRTCPTYYWAADVYDIETKQWLPLEAPRGIPGWRVMDCFLWVSVKYEKKMIVLLICKSVKVSCSEEEEEEEGNASRNEYVMKFLYYDLIRQEWDSDVAATDGLVFNTGPYRMVVAEDTLYHVQGVDWIMYDLHGKCIKGKVEGLERMKELLGIEVVRYGALNARTPDDVVYLGSHEKFCILWERWVEDKYVLHFALVSVEGNGTKFSGTISSDGIIPLMAGQNLVSCCVMPASHQAINTNNVVRKRKMEGED